MRIGVDDINLPEEDRPLLREACEARAKYYGRILYETKDTNIDTTLFKDKHRKYQELYRTFGGEDPI